MVVKSLKRAVKIAIVILFLPVYAHAWDCAVSISGLNTVEMGESISLTASGNRYGGTYSWSSWPYNLGSGQTINFTGKVPGKAMVWVDFYEWGKWQYKWSCSASKEITVTGEAKLRKISGDNQKGVKGSNLYEPFVVEVVDKHNKPVSGALITYQVKQNPPGTYWWEKGTLSTSYAYTDSSGRASSKLKLGAKLGIYKVEASCANCTSGSPQTFTAEAVTVTLKKETGDNQSGQMKKELKEPFVVKVTDATGAGVGGVYVSFSVAQKPSGSTGSYPSPSYTYTNADGTASSTLILGDKTGDYKVNAYCYAASSGSPQTFTAKAEDVSYTMSKVSGDEQNGYIEKPLKEPFAVKVIDANSKPVENLPIQWVITKMPDGAKGTSLSYATTTTASDGTTGTTLTFGDTHGVYTVEARCDQCGNTSPQVFTTEALGIKINLDLNKPQVYPSGTSGDSSTTIKVIAEYMDGTPVDDGYPVQISAKAVENSGGHDHTGQRPVGEITGGSCRISSSAGCIEPEISGTTTGGKFEVTYKASKFGGTEKVTAVSKKHPKVESVSKDLTVKVPDLGRFVEYEGIWKLKQPTSIHSDSYWIHNHMYYFLYMIGSEYRNEYPDAETLVITDISLKDGGEFDLGGNWCSRCINPATGKRYGHVSHRVGKSVDVRISNIPESNRIKFIEICKDYLARAGNHGNHYHLDF